MNLSKTDLYHLLRKEEDLRLKIADLTKQLELKQIIGISSRKDSQIRIKIENLKREHLRVKNHLALRKQKKKLTSYVKAKTTKQQGDDIR